MVVVGVEREQQFRVRPCPFSVAPLHCQGLGACQATQPGPIPGVGPSQAPIAGRAGFFHRLPQDAGAALNQCRLHRFPEILRIAHRMKFHCRGEIVQDIDAVERFRMTVQEAHPDVFGVGIPGKRGLARYFVNGERLARRIDGVPVRLQDPQRFRRLKREKRVDRLVRRPVAAFEVPSLFEQFRRHRADVLFRNAHPAHLRCDFQLGVGARIERRHRGDFVGRQRAPLDAGQRLEQPLARTAGCIDECFRQGSVGILVNCRQECDRALEFLDVQLHQAPAPDARALTRPLGPVFGQEKVDLQ